VCKPAEDLPSADPVLGEVDLRRPGAALSRRELAEGTMRPGCVVVAHVLDQHPAQMVLTDDQQRHCCIERSCDHEAVNLPAGNRWALLRWSITDDGRLA